MCLATFLNEPQSASDNGEFDLVFKELATIKTEILLW